MCGGQICFKKMYKKKIHYVWPSMVTHTQNLCSAFNPSKCTLTVVNTHPEQWAAIVAVPGEQLGVRCLAQGSHLSRGQSLPEPRFEPTTSGYKSNTLSIRSRLPLYPLDPTMPPGSRRITPVHRVALIHICLFAKHY